MKILFLVNNYFPRGVAYSSRAVAFCRLLSFIGHQVHVIAMRSNEGHVKPGNIYTFDGCTYECVVTSKPNSVESFIGNKWYYSCIQHYLSNNHVDAVLTSACPHDFQKILRLCHQLSIPVYLEQCEWYDRSNFTFGRIDPRYLRISRLIANGYRKADGIIAISRLLEQHYTEQNVPVIRIPTILDVNNTEWRQDVSENVAPIQIVYTGSCGVSKEYLKPMIVALAKESTLCKKIVFHIYGPSKRTVLMNIGNDKTLLNQAGDSVVIHERVPQEQISQIIRNADYQLFIRPDRRSSNAGFPTKLGESMCVGTPVITNNTGDISLYLKNGINGYLLDNNKISSLINMLYNILKTTVDERSKMRKAARKAAEEFFDFRRYDNKINMLLSEHKNIRTEK